MSERRGRPRVLLVLSTIFRARGGIPRFNQLLCRSFDELAPELGYAGVVVSQDDAEEHYREAGAPWRHLEFEAGGGKRRTAAATLRRALRERPALVLIGHLGMTPLGAACSPFARWGYGFVAHGTEAWSVPRWSRRFAVRRAARALVVSRFTGELLCRETGLPADRLRLLPNALEPGIETMDATPRDGADGAVEVLSVARLDAGEGQKGIDHTIRAVSRLATRHPNLRYRIVGRGTDKPRLERLASEAGLEGRVVFEQDLSDEELAERYRRCSVFALPSGQEGFGIVFLEAMRFGKPCIGGDAGGTPEVIEDGRTGLLVPFGDVDQLEQALERMLLDPTLRAELGRQGTQRLLERFVFDRYRDNVRTILGEWLDGTTEPR